MAAAGIAAVAAAAVSGETVAAVSEAQSAAPLHVVKALVATELGADTRQVEAAMGADSTIQADVVATVVVVVVATVVVVVAVVAATVAAEEDVLEEGAGVVVAMAGAEAVEDEGARLEVTWPSHCRWL